jgi:hypothetical protein
MAKLHVDYLCEQITESNLHWALKALPEDRNEAYENIINRIYSQPEMEMCLAMSTLKWITFAKEPLKTGALQHALSTTVDTKEINENDVISVEQLVSFCAGMVIVDDESGIIKHVHYTAQKYLESKLSRVQSNLEIATTCVRYLGFHVFSKPCRNEDSINERTKKYVLSSYAALHWADHVREGPLDEDLDTLILSTFKNDGTRDSIHQLRGHASSEFFLPYGCSLVHFASFYGLFNICQTLLDNYKRARLGRSMPKRLFKHERLYILP